MTRYLKIYSDLKAKILSEAVKYGEKLPSKRVTAENYGVSVITVEHAYELLFEEGYIVSREKSGYFVSYKENEGFSARPDKARTTPATPGVSPETLGASGLYRSTGISQVFATLQTGEAGHSEDEGISYNLYAKTARRVLTDYGDILTERSEGYGCFSLREAISSYLAAYRDIHVPAERIIVGAGAEYLYGLIIKALGRERIYGAENPSYQKIAAIYGAEQVKLELLDLGSDGIESEMLWNSKADVLHITPYRSFPTGVTASAAKKAEYLKWSVQKNGLIIEDDFESEFTPSRKPEETLFSLDKNGRVIYVNTFTKTVGPYIRAAYMVIPESLEHT
nr:PLP-dependent aminotransferase family protein [Lachnospiraceae bacterium]